MLMQAKRALEELVTSLTIVVFFETVLHQLVIVVKVTVTLTTKVVLGTLDPVLSKS